MTTVSIISGKRLSRKDVKDGTGHTVMNNSERSWGRGEGHQTKKGKDMSRRGERRG